MTEASGELFKSRRLCHKQGYFIFGSAREAGGGVGGNEYLQEQGNHIAEG